MPNPSQLWFAYCRGSSPESTSESSNLWADSFVSAASIQKVEKVSSYLWIRLKRLSQAHSDQTKTQHTSVETAEAREVRYVHQPLGDLKQTFFRKE